MLKNSSPPLPPCRALTGMSEWEVVVGWRDTDRDRDDDGKTGKRRVEKTVGRWKAVEVYARKKRATTAKSKMRYINYSARDDEPPTTPYPSCAQPVRLYNNQAKTYFCDFNKNFTTLFRAPAGEVLTFPLSSTSLSPSSLRFLYYNTWFIPPPYPTATVDGWIQNIYCAPQTNAY